MLQTIFSPIAKLHSFLNGPPIPKTIGPQHQAQILKLLETALHQNGFALDQVSKISGSSECYGMLDVKFTCGDTTTIATPNLNFSPQEYTAAIKLQPENPHADHAHEIREDTGLHPASL